MTGQALRFVDVILPVPLPGSFTYALPLEWHEQVMPGIRVVVQFGSHKVFAAVVRAVHDRAPSGYAVKPVLDVLDPRPVLAARQLDFWTWISDYYLSTPGDVMAAALPVALRLQSETRITLHPDFNGDHSALTDREYMVAEALEIQSSLTLKEIGTILQLKNPMPVVRNLLSKGVAAAQEEVEERVKPLFIDVIAFGEACATEEQTGAWMTRLEKRAARQLDILMAFLQICREGDVKEVEKAVLLKRAGASTTVLAAMVKQGVFAIHKRRVDRVRPYEGAMLPPVELNPHQVQALLEIRQGFAEGKVVMLHGVTSSGKTEVYIHLIAEALAEGRQVLYLLPEIALTMQLIGRLQKHFGDRMLVYHSRFNEQERVEVWNKLLDDNLNTIGSGRLVVGARSAVLLPFDKLGLVIVDEEHDHSYKQIDPAPRYHARDAAVVLAARQDARVLLGSATPSMESYFNALSGKYALVTLDKRHAGLEMPLVRIVDMKEARKRRQVQGHFSQSLLEELRMNLEAGKQSILFQNRRGFAPSLECNLCSWSPRCVNCDVSLTYHKKNNELRCHYCGYVQSMPQRCGACGDQDLRMRGYGTERIEEELKLMFPEARVARLDYDTTRSKSGYQTILSSFEEGAVDVLIGTQMVTKGLDFDKVSLVGILNADALMGFPEFRAHERGFQLLAQVSGRAGRRDQGHVVVQSYNVHHPVLSYVLRHDFQGFYFHELNERHRFHYPPYYRLIEVRLKHKDERQLERMASQLVVSLKKTFGNRVLGPTSPYVSRVRNYHLRHLLIKIEKTLVMGDVKKRLVTALEDYRKLPENRALIVLVDVDPL